MTKAASAQEAPAVGAFACLGHLASSLASSRREEQHPVLLRRSREKQTMSNRLYVGNLSFSTNQAAIEATFATCGEVREVSMPTDRETGQPRGFAFVTMGNAQAANAAIA